MESLACRFFLLTSAGLCWALTLQLHFLLLPLLATLLEVSASARRPEELGWEAWWGLWKRQLVPSQLARVSDGPETWPTTERAFAKAASDFPKRARPQATPWLLKGRAVSPDVLTLAWESAPRNEAGSLPGMSHRHPSRLGVLEQSPVHPVT